ncbi:hypothetical protein [Xenorhabdus cabanillasii]|uniref:Uncharacterized protein n=1 Tax=Xenorhabdus cabanillasii JM26 TaxID=1427517 RepID=W1IXN9_9GAMM|nr:hypothetical protein [Xenorhabdus cabanillasii]PHM78563.1 hypothetical protein Xcab_00718 [Xenorhabdus cabanillasii JM26]CDL81960.1 exported hypothetical protein [Xenorhabdus cabanillasii JM26]
MKNFTFGCVLSFLLLPGAVYADSMNVKALYKKMLDNIVDNVQCNEQEFTLEIPRRNSDNEDVIQLYATRFTNSVLVNFAIENNKVGINIDVYPMPKTPDEQLIAFCVVSAVQAAIDPSKTTNEYMKLGSKMYSSTLKFGRYEYQSKKYEHSAYIDIKSQNPTLHYVIDSID